MAQHTDALPEALLFTKVDNDTDFAGDLSPALALQFIKRQVPGRRFFIATRPHAPVVGEPDKYFPLLGNVRVPQAEAARWVADVWGGRFMTEALVPLRVLGACVFIG
jgi:hypothetical protein